MDSSGPVTPVHDRLPLSSLPTRFQEKKATATHSGPNDPPPPLPPPPRGLACVPSLLLPSSAPEEPEVYYILSCVRAFLPRQGDPSCVTRFSEERKSKRDPFLTPTKSERLRCDVRGVTRAAADGDGGGRRPRGAAPPARLVGREEGRFGCCWCVRTLEPKAGGWADDRGGRFLLLYLFALSFALPCGSLS